MAPFGPNEAVAVYRAASRASRVFRTVDTGATWTDISGNLPIQPLGAVVIDPNTSPYAIIVATDSGVMRTANLGATWETLGANLPNVQCTSLALDWTPVPSLLRVGTYGRSAFELAFDRKYVDPRNSGTQDGTRENPFGTLVQALNAPATGAAR